MVSHGYKNLGEYITQMTMFNDDDVFKTDKAFVLNSFLNEKVNSLKTALLRYNNSAESNSGSGLFGDNLTPGQVFDAIFVKEAEQSVIKALLIKNQHEPSQNNGLTDTSVIQPAVEPEADIMAPLNLKGETPDEENHENVVEPEPPVQAPVETESPKESLQLRIERLEKTLKYQNEQDKPQVEQLINRLKKALKYL
jgi:hypothetical protein